MSTEEPASEETPPLPDLLPVLPLRDMVLFPFIILPLSVAREKSIQAVDRSLSENRMLMLVAQQDPATEDPKAEDLFGVGTVASITRMLKLPDGRIRILVQGVARAKVTHLAQSEPFLQAKIEQLPDQPLPQGPLEVEALVRSVRQELEKAVQLGKTISPEVMVIVANLDDPGRLADLVASNLELRLADAQGVLEERRPGGAAAQGGRRIGTRDAAARHAAGDRLPGSRRDGRDAARVLPAPAAQGDPAGARRGGRAGGRDCRLAPAGGGEAAVREPPRRSSSGRSAARAQPSRLARRRRSSAPTWTGSPACRGGW